MTNFQVKMLTMILNTTTVKERYAVLLVLTRQLSAFEKVLTLVAINITTLSQNIAQLRSMEI